MSNEQLNPAPQDDPWWLPGCLANIKQLGGNICSQDHCTDAQNSNHKVCYCQAPYPNGCAGKDPNSGCCSYTATSPVIVFLPNGSCYCCCGCFANGTPVHVSKNASKPIEEILVGDMVYVAMDASLSTWAEKTVEFSSGTGPDSGHRASVMIKMDLTAPEGPITLYVTPNQVFYMGNGKIKRANRLVPGQDELLMGNAAKVKIDSLTVGLYGKGVHHIATSEILATTVEGHLMLANGIVSGDYALQLTNDPRLFVDGHHQLPEVGTKEYLQAYAHILGENSPYAVAAVAGPGNYKGNGKDDGILRQGDSAFTPWGTKPKASIPDKVNYFVNNQQALDIQKNAPAWPITSRAGRDTINYLFKFYKGFYPLVNFYFDEENEIPNAYSFNEYGTSFVVFNGGLARLQCMGFELMALIIGHELGHLYGGDPKGKNGYTCEGASDFFGLANFGYIWYGMFATPYRIGALQQVQVLFDFIDPDHRGGLPGSRCRNISIDCRMSALNAANTSKPLPWCAGGPADPFLEVSSASGEETTTWPQVKVTFNVPVNAATATETGNYAFYPNAKTYGVAMDPDDDKSVLISAEITTDVEYRVTVYNVLSADDQPLVAGKNTAKFTMAPATAGKKKTAKI